MASVKAKDRFIIMLGVFITFVSLGGAFALGDYTQPPGEGEEPDEGWVTASYTMVFDGYVAEGASEHEGIQLDEKKVTEITFTLTWQDEPADNRHTNEPDQLELEVTSPFGSESESSTEGEVEISFKAQADEPWDMREEVWNATTTAVSCGDMEPIVPDPLGLRTQQDGGNSYTLDVEIKFLTKEKKSSQE